jgi:hypothetical protein
MLRRAQPILIGFVAFALGCGGGEGDGTEASDRDLTLAPAESVAMLSDAPPPATPTPGTQRPATTPTQPTTTRPAAPRPSPRVLPEGTVIELAAIDTITSRVNKAGDAVSARAIADVKDPQGRVLVPAGSMFRGVIDQIKEAESPGGQGTLVLAFREVQIGSSVFAITARTDTVGAEMKGRGVTAGDAAKVGVGAAAGAIAGRVIGGNTKGAVIGGVVGAAAGAGIAVATHDEDIVLPAGGLIRLVLSAPLTLEAGS